MKLYLLAVGIFVAFLVGISIYLGGSLADGRSHRVVWARYGLLVAGSLRLGCSAAVHLREKTLTRSPERNRGE
jgi:hypothetical protein